MRIHSRGELGARSFTTPPPIVPLSSRDWLINHYPGAGTPPRELEALRRWIENIHMNQRRWRGVGYNYVIDAYGNVGEGAGRDVVGAHSPPHNRDGIGVMYWCSNGITTPEAMHAGVQLRNELNREKGGTPLRIGYHGMDFPTECPGDQIRSWSKKGMPDPLAGTVVIPPLGDPTPISPRGLLDMADIKIIRRAKHVAQHGKWSTVRLNDRGDLTLYTGPGNVIVTVQVQADIPAGASLQGRFYQVNFRKGSETVRVPGTTLPPLMELEATGGQTFGSAVYMDPISAGPEGWSRRLRFELVAWTKNKKPINVPRIEFRVMGE